MMVVVDAVYSRTSPLRVCSRSADGARPQAPDAPAIEAAMQHLRWWLVALAVAVDVLS